MRVLVELNGPSLQVLEHLLPLLLQVVHLDLLHLLLEVLAHQHLAVHPRVAEDLGDGHPVGGVEGQHGAEQVLELCRELALLLVGRPELVEVVEGDELVEAVVGGGRDEGSVGRDQDEEGDASRKQVVHHPVVILAHE